MATSAIPHVIDALVTLAQQHVPDCLVFDGYGITDEDGTSLMIGAEDPDSRDYAQSATARQEVAHAGYRYRDETGTITCVAVSFTGDNDQKGPRDEVFRVAAAVEDFLRADYTLGLSDLTMRAIYGGNVELEQNATDDGCIALLKFTVAYQARI